MHVTSSCLWDMLLNIQTRFVAAGAIAAENGGRTVPEVNEYATAGDL